MGTGGSKQTGQAGNQTSYEVSIRTGDRFFSGTNADVFVTLCGNNVKSEEATMDTVFKDDFERGHTDKFMIKNTAVPELEYIELRRGKGHIGDGWFVVSIAVKNKRSGNLVEFPILRWVKADIRYTLLPLDTYLPQKDTRPERKRELSEKQKAYNFRKWWPGLPPEDTLPEDERFSLLEKLRVVLPGALPGISSLLKKFTLKEFNSIDDIKSMYSSCGFAVPPDMNKWNDDCKFALQRIAGINNSQIALCKEVPTKLGVTSEMIEPFLEGKSMTEAITERRLFIVDHKCLNKITPESGLIICAPIALFYQQNNGTLMPIAIQLYQEKGQDNPVFLPTDDKFTWILAKMWFNHADAQVHESVSHLGNTHLVMDGAACALERQLSLSHPIYKLLKPHFLYLLAINTFAITDLMNKPDGFFNVNLSVGTDLGLELIHRNRKIWRMDVEGTLPNDLTNRGVEDPKLLPDYYFREDALELYNATKRYVADYVDIYYTSQADLADDNEIQAWRAELTKEIPNGASLNGVPGHNRTIGRFVEKEELTLTLTSIIYTCSVEHAAVNFGQYHEYGFPLNYPSVLRGSPPKDKNPRQMEDVFKALSEPELVMKGNVIFTILSKRSTQALGDFEINYIYDPQAKQVLANFRKQLSQISKNVQKRQKSRKVAYTYLDPKEIPNAISI